MICSNWGLAIPPKSPWSTTDDDRQSDNKWVIKPLPFTENGKWVPNKNLKSQNKKQEKSQSYNLPPPPSNTKSRVSPKALYDKNEIKLPNNQINLKVDENLFKVNIDSGITKIDKTNIVGSSLSSPLAFSSSLSSSSNNMFSGSNSGMSAGGVGTVGIFGTSGGMSSNPLAPMSLGSSSLSSPLVSSSMPPASFSAPLNNNLVLGNSVSPTGGSSNFLSLGSNTSAQSNGLSFSPTSMMSLTSGQSNNTGLGSLSPEKSRVSPSAVGKSKSSNLSSQSTSSTTSTSVVSFSNQSTMDGKVANSSSGSNSSFLGQSNNFTSNSVGVSAGSVGSVGSFGTSGGMSSNPLAPMSLGSGSLSSPLASSSSLSSSSNNMFSGSNSGVSAGGVGSFGTSGGISSNPLAPMSLGINYKS